MLKLKKIINITLAGILVLTLLMSVITVINRESKENFIYRNKEPKKIGATYMTLNNPFYQIIDNEIRSVVNANGDILISLDPQLSLERQVQQLEYLIEQDVDAIVLTAVDFNGLTSSLKKASEAGIPILVVDTDIPENDYVSFSITSDNYQAGVECAKDMMKKKSHADIVLLRHSKAYSALQRIQGFVDTIKDNPNYRIVENIECNGQLEVAMPKMKQFLNKNVPFDVVMGLNDPSILGAVAAMQEQNRLKDVLVYGVDGSPEVKDLIKDGFIEGTVVQSPKTMGKETAEILYRILNKKGYAKSEKIEVTLITKENIHEHSLEGWE